MSTTAIILAAGGSTRMGSPKALLMLEGQTLLAHHLAALRPHCDQLCVVLGGDHDRIRATLGDDVAVVVNPDWEHTGLRESLGLALQPLAPNTLSVVTPVDAAPAPARVLRALLAHGAPAVPSHQGRPGHPVLVQVGPTREGLRHGTLRDVLATAPRVEVDWPDTLLNLNTPRAWEAWRASYRPWPGTT